MPASILKCMRTVYELERSGYKINLWNEDNYDVSHSEILLKAYNNKRWSLVSNYVRLDVLSQHGGVYLDTDVEVIRNFDDLLDRQFFIGFMWDCTLGTAIIGAEPHHPVIDGILQTYDAQPSSFKSPNNNTFTDYFLEQVQGFELNGHQQDIGGIVVLDKYAFEHPSLLKSHNYTIHKFEQSWISQDKLKKSLKKIIIQTMSLWLYRKWICWKSLRISPYYDRYVESVRRTKGVDVLHQ